MQETKKIKQASWFYDKIGYTPTVELFKERLSTHCQYIKNGWYGTFTHLKYENIFINAFKIKINYFYRFYIFKPQINNDVLDIVSLYKGPILTIDGHSKKFSYISGFSVLDDNVVMITFGYHDRSSYWATIKLKTLINFLPNDLQEELLN